MRQQRLIVTGSQNLKNYALAVRSLDKCVLDWGLDTKSLEVVTNGCNGADKLGQMWARRNYLGVMEYHTGLDGDVSRTNEAMARYATHCVVFARNLCKTRSCDMIEKAKRHGLKLRVVNY